MISFIRIIWAFLLSMSLLACTGHNSPESTELALMQSEHMERCLSRREYQSRNPEKIEKHCRCIFKTAMKGRSEDEQMTIAFYLYGEKNEAFKERFRANPPELDAMMPAVKAIEQAVKKCPL